MAAKDTGKISNKAQKRHDAIRAMLSKKDIVTVQEFVSALKVSEATIRNDLSYLEQQNTLKRILGGAISNEQTLQNTSFRLRKNICTKEKGEIAHYVVANLIKPNMIIGLDAGTTCLAIAEELVRADIHCTVVTYSYAVAQALHPGNDIVLYLAAGQLDYEHDSFHDENTIRMMQTMKCDLFFLSCNGIDEKGSITSSATDENIIKEIMIENASSCYVVCTHEKLQKRAIKHLLYASEAAGILIDYEEHAANWVNKNRLDHVLWVKKN